MVWRDELNEGRILLRDTIDLDTTFGGGPEAQIDHTVVPREGTEGAPGAKGMRALQAAFDANVMIRITGDTMAFSPPLIIEESHIAHAVDTVREVLRSV